MRPESVAGSRQVEPALGLGDVVQAEEVAGAGVTPR